MRDTRFPCADDIGEEVHELHELADRLSRQRPELTASFDELKSELREQLAASDHPAMAERATEGFARRLRAQWLNFAAADSSRVYRSPTEGQIERLQDGRHDTFGYERDLQPHMLERRCDGCFDPPPEGWACDYILFSSGQAAMTATLIALGRRHADRTIAPMRLIHLGAYFETQDLLDAMPLMIRGVADEASADVLIIEPVSCDGRLQRIDAVAVLAKRRVSAVIFDTTLSAFSGDVSSSLAADGAPDIAVQVCSGLKLMQGGLELANVGIVSVFERKGSSATKSLAECLRRLRTLTGGGLHSVDAVALEAPWFLDRTHADRYARAVCANNAALATAVARTNRRFEPVTHPALEGDSSAPFCVFRLRQPCEAAYDSLEDEIAAEASRRRLVLDKGGSFGFRGHRFEVVRPENGTAPFLRVAMGRRSGWSRDGLITMLTEFAQKNA